MIRFIFVTALCFAAVGTGSLACGADPVPIDNRTCFCLRHTASGAIATGCHGSKDRTDFYATAICWDEHAQKPGTSVTVDQSMKLGLAQTIVRPTPEFATGPPSGGSHLIALG